MKYAIEDSFPIVEINRLAIPEKVGSGVRPIYTMGKWFARRASCVFRAILLGCMKPLPLDDNGNPLKSGAEIIMEEFYKDHTNDSDTKGKVILDPFMGGGTTVVEALRLGCKVIGIDLNPIAWFIVKTEVEPVNIDELKASFRRLSERKVIWGEKSVKETLLEQYKTECPCCGAGREEADIIYTFWVKSAICTNPLCKKEIPLFSDYIIANKSPSIRYSPEVECPECGKSFDWEIEPASLIAEPGLCVVSSTYSAGIGRTTARWAFSTDNEVECPWCHKQVKAKAKIPKPKRKKVLLTILLCPHCYSVWQWRGDLPEEVNCPVCKKSYSPKAGNVPKSGWFLCPSCGHTDKIINSIRSLPEDNLLPLRPCAIEGYCKVCARDVYEDIDSQQMNLDGTQSELKIRKSKLPGHTCLITKNNGKFFKRVTPADLARYQRASDVWEKEKGNLLYPKQKIPWGEKTKSGLIAHHYLYWHQMFNSRQLLCLSTLLKAINEEPNQVLKEMLLNSFQSALNNANVFCRYNRAAHQIEPCFSRHDFQPKLDFPEQNVWGTKYGRGTLEKSWNLVIEAKHFCQFPFDASYSCTGKRYFIQSNERIHGTVTSEKLSLNQNNTCVCLVNKDSCYLSDLEDSLLELIITDPPYASNVNYSELSDFFYVWLRLILAKNYREFAPELTPKAEEIIENPTRGKTSKDFEEGLTQVFQECNKVLNDNGILAFTCKYSDNP